MNSINPRSLSLLVAALCMSVLWTSSAHAMSNSYARESHGSKTRSNESKRETTQVREAALLKKAYALAEKIAYENDRTSKVQVDSVTFEMVPTAKLGEEVWADARMQCPNARGRNQTVSIRLSRALKRKNPAVQAHSILHELAHTYDQTGWDAVRSAQPDTSFDSYPFLKKDMLACRKKWAKAASEMSASEWYADWQSIQWMKKYTPEHVSALKEEFKALAEEDKYQGLKSLVYPPAEILLKWLDS